MKYFYLFAFPWWNVSPLIQKYIAQQGSDFSRPQYAASFESLKECTRNSSKDFHVLTEYHSIAGELNVVFRKFIHLSPKIAWNKSAQFELLVAPAPHLSFEIKDKTASIFPALHKDQLYFLTLDIGGIKKIPVAFKIVVLNTTTHHIAFSYLKSNKSIGLQDIRFYQVDHRVIIEHTTCFKSDSSLRDYIYPYFHSQLLKEFYAAFFSTLD